MAKRALQPLRIGYARVSTHDQSLEMQLDALKRTGCKRIFTDKLSGARLERLGLKEALSQLREGPPYGTLAHMIKEKIPELQKLSTADKFALAVELWDELSSNADEIPVTEDQLNELDRRFEEYCQDPNKVVTWEAAKARILSSRH